MAGCRSRAAMSWTWSPTAPSMRFTWHGSRPRPRTIWLPPRAHSPGARPAYIRALPYARRQGIAASWARMIALLEARRAGLLNRVHLAPNIVAGLVVGI